MSDLFHFDVVILLNILQRKDDSIQQIYRYLLFNVVDFVHLSAGFQ